MMPGCMSGCQLGLEIPPTHLPLLRYIHWANPPSSQGIATMTLESEASAERGSLSRSWLGCFRPWRGRAVPPGQQRA